MASDARKASPAAERRDVKSTSKTYRSVSIICLRSRSGKRSSSDSNKSFSSSTELTASNASRIVATLNWCTRRWSLCFATNGACAVVTRRRVAELRACGCMRRGSACLTTELSTKSARLGWSRWDEGRGGTANRQ
eukprot:7376419-Prymnesium_polylepis.1